MTINLKYIIDLNVKAKTIKLLEKKENLSDTRFGKGFLNKQKITFKKLINLFHQNFDSSKDTAAK